MEEPIQINGDQENPIHFHGKSGEFFSIWIVNILLSIVTLGIYSAWAKVRTNRYFYGNTELSGDRFDYHAKPMQILKGRIVAALVVILWVIATEFLDPAIGGVVVLAFYLALPWLLWANARFDAAMTSYRNVRFSFQGRLIDAYKTLLGRGIIVFALVIGLIVWWVFALQSGSSGAAFNVTVVIGAVIIGFIGQVWIIHGAWQYFINGYQFGENKVSATLKLGKFFQIYLISAVLGIVSLLALAIVGGLLVFSGSIALDSLDFDSLLFSIGSVAVVFAVYFVVLSVTLVVTSYIVSQTRNYVFSQAQLENGETPLHFRSTLSALGYAALIITNLLAQLFSIGLARPWVKVRTARYVAKHTFVLGDVENFITQKQAQGVKSAIGDEVAQAFDVGIGIN
ncbi:YjgN family protein [Vibrio sonorensis]|uniref:YjgN family protein n=1 Tax=Vibrio sonorensis TaxID=1004316 RepID=UPI0008DB265E|nr:YjgN family protein [Vibrio sonorensis]